MISYNSYLSDYFYLLCGRLQVQCFHFFVSHSEINHATLIKLYTLACSTIDSAMQLDGTQNLSGSATAFVSKMLYLAACTILRITRSHLNQNLDLARGQRSYFSVILFHRKMSVQQDDIASRSIVILTQLWTSTTVFEQADGTIDSLLLCCRNRLAMSIVFDCFWRWRREFAGQSHPYEKEDLTSKLTLFTCNCVS